MVECDCLHFSDDEMLTASVTYPVLYLTTKIIDRFFHTNRFLTSSNLFLCLDSLQLNHFILYIFFYHYGGLYVCWSTKTNHTHS